MIGLFQRRTLPNRVDDLVESFAPVAHFWQRKIPGCLWASVAKDDEEDDTVWDVRIFADKASYAAHVDDSDAKMTAAMEAWFGHYDDTKPFVGALYGVERGEARLGSSMEKKPKQAFVQYDYRSSSFLGAVAGERMKGLRV